MSDHIGASQRARGGGGGPGTLSLSEEEYILKRQLQRIRSLSHESDMGEGPSRNMRCRFLKRILNSSLCHMIIVLGVFSLIIATQPHTTRQYVTLTEEGKTSNIIKKHKKLKHWKQQSQRQARDGIKDIKDAAVPKLKIPSKYTHQFEDYNLDGVVSFHNVCIEIDPGKTTRRKKSHAYPRKRLVVYNSEIDGVKHLGKKGNDSKSWELVLKKGKIPKGSNYIQRHTAVFDKFQDTNLFINFWKDVYVGLYATLEKTKRLNSTYQNHVFTNHNMHKMDMFKNMFSTINVHPSPATFHSIAPNTCYKNAVFGTLPSTPWRKPAEYLIKRLDIDKTHCNAFTVTILQSFSYRRIVNADPLKKYLSQLNPSIQVQVTVITKVTINRLLEILSCTDILITGQALGSPWIAFMKPGTVVLEVLWPTFGNVLANLNKKQGLKLKVVPVTLESQQLKLNWDAYDKVCNKGKPVDQSVKDKLLKVKPGSGASGCANVFSHSDVFIKPDALKTIIKSFLPKVKKSTEKGNQAEKKSQNITMPKSPQNKQLEKQVQNKNQNKAKGKH